jgi:hypothetical protein
MAPGSAWLGASSAFWKANTGRQIDVPVMMAAIGLARRAQMGGSVPIYHFRDPNGLSAHGIGTVSLYGKLMLLDPAATHRFGLAVAPLFELAPGADKRVGWALPINIEARTRRLRIYGSTGYFSRGSVFGAIAAEVAAGSRTSITGTFGQSYAAGSHQTDISIGLALATSRTTSAFVSLGRAFTSDAMPGSVSFGGGISLAMPFKSAKTP